MVRRHLVICSTGLFCKNKTCYSERAAKSWEKAERKEKWGPRTLMSFWFVQLSGWEQDGRLSLDLQILDLRCL